MWDSGRWKKPGKMQFSAEGSIAYGIHLEVLSSIFGIQLSYSQGTVQGAWSHPGGKTSAWEAKNRA